MDFKIINTTAIVFGNICIVLTLFFHKSANADKSVHILRELNKQGKLHTCQRVNEIIRLSQNCKIERCVCVYIYKQGNLCIHVKG